MTIMNEIAALRRFMILKTKLAMTSPPGTVLPGMRVYYNEKK